MPVDNPNRQDRSNSTSIHEGKISSLPKTYIGALSAIQEQAFIDSEAEDYGLYGKLFTNNHKIAFFRVGFFAGLIDSFFLVLGYILYELAKYKVIYPFGHENLSLIDKIVLLLIQFFPYLLTLILTGQTFSYLTGTIPRKMAKYLLNGFFSGSIFAIFILLILSYWSGIEYAEGVYNFLSILSKNMADLFWYYLRIIFENGIWDEAGMILAVNMLLFLIYVVQINRIEKQKNIDEINDEF